MFRKFLEYKIINLEHFQLTPYHILIIILIIVLTRIILWAIRKIFHGERLEHKLDQGQRFALYQIIKYFLIVIALAITLESVGIKVTILVAGSAALLVGIGFGMQQIFNDFISGIIILVEGTIKVGDILEIEGDVGKVTSIMLRTSEIETRDNINVIIPNSKLTSEKIINWSHNKQATRFDIKIGVSYGSDVDLVTKILIECAKEHDDISKNREPKVRFFDFGDSALLFYLRFWSKSMFRVEKIKSDLRYTINSKFREHGIHIPYPQRDLHIKSQPDPEK